MALIHRLIVIRRGVVIAQHSVGMLLRYQWVREAL